MFEVLMPVFTLIYFLLFYITYNNSRNWSSKNMKCHKTVRVTREETQKLPTEWKDVNQSLPRGVLLVEAGCRHNFDGASRRLEQLPFGPNNNKKKHHTHDSQCFTYCEFGGKYPEEQSNKRIQVKPLGLALWQKRDQIPPVALHRPLTAQRGIYSTDVRKYNTFLTLDSLCPLHPVSL